MRLAPVLAVVIASLAAAADLAPPPRGTWVVDNAGVLTTDAIDRLNALATSLDAQGTAQLGVAIINTTSGAPPRAFATKLFNTWGIGHAERNDGVLIFAAIKDRKAEIILGSGAVITTAQTDVVMKNDIIANFKRGDASAAILAAGEAIAALLPAPTKPEPAPVIDPRYARLARGEEAFADYSPRHWLIDLSNSFSARDASSIEVPSNDVFGHNKGRVFILVTNNEGTWPTLGELVTRFKHQVRASSSSKLAVVALDLHSGDVVIDVPHDERSQWERGLIAEQVQMVQSGFRIERNVVLRSAALFASRVLTRGMTPRPMNDVLREGFERYGTTLFIGALFGSGIGLALIARWWHRRPRQCTECKKPRELLNRKSEQPHLNEGQNKEEDLGSVWFDVWWCARCRDTEVIRRDTVFTRYKPCSGCGHKTALKTDGHTLTYATTFSHGEIEVIETCEHCGHVAKYTRTTPRLQEAVTALYDASSSSSFSDSFSSSSSSDSSSFDGGSSDGGGSSGSW